MSRFKSPTPEPITPGNHIFTPDEITAMTDERLCQLHDQARELVKSDNRGVWAKALINKQNFELVIKERAADRAQLELFATEG